MTSKILNTFERFCGNTTVLSTVIVLAFCLFFFSCYRAYQDSLSATAQSLKTDVGNQARIVAASVNEYFCIEQDNVQKAAEFPFLREFLDRVRQDTIENDPNFVDICSMLEVANSSNRDVAITWLASLRDDFFINHNRIFRKEDGWSIHSRPWFSGAMKAEGIYFSAPFQKFETDSVRVSLIKKVYAPLSDNPDDVHHSEEVVGFVGLDISLQSIYQAMKEFTFDDEHYPILISYDGTILYHPNEQLILKCKLGDIDPALKQFTEKMVHSESVTDMIALNDGQCPVYFGYVPVKGKTWSVGIIWNKHDAEKTLFVFRQTLVRSLLLNLFLFVLLIILFGFAITLGTQRFTSMKHLYDVVVNQMQTGIAVVDLKTDAILLANPAYKSFLGMSQENPMPFSTYHSLLGIDLPSGTFQTISKCNETPDDVPETTEILLRLNDTDCYLSHFFIGFRTDAGRRLFLSVLTDITEQKNMQETLRLSRDTAESANHAKSSFLANMSHEIRTPMNGIVGLTNLLAATPLDPQQKEFIELVRSSATALLTIINDILDHSKIEAGKLLIESYVFDLRRLIRELTFSFSHAAQQKSIEFQTWLSPDVPQFVRGDGNRVRQVLVNFLSNAIKFTENGKVELRGILLDEPEKPNWVRFEVSDTGIGISDSQMMQLFKPFEQADSSTARKFGGTGLGLSISKRLVQMMGGTVGGHSQRNAGTVFWCELPLPVSSEVLSQDEQTVVISILKPMQILLVDDVKVNLIMLSAMLQHWGHFVETAENGKQAIELMKKHRYELVFMDCQMPEMDGYECTQKIRDLETRVLNPNVPIIAVTAHAMVGDKERCLASGMDDYISKPVDHNVLQSKLAKWAPK